MPALQTPKSDQFSRVPVVDLHITACTNDDVHTIISEAISGALPPQQLATVNLDFLRLADSDPELRAVLMRSSHCFADGWPIISLAASNGPHPARAGYRFRPDAKDTSVGQGQRLAGRLRRRHH